MVPPQAHQNGYMENGTAPASQALGPRGLIQRTEYIRVLEQALRALGYEQVAAQLEAASGIVQQSPQVDQFRTAVLSGQYDDALQLLPFVAADEAVMERARFMLLRQKYVERVKSAPAEALQVLRQELQPLGVQQQMLHSLAALLLHPPQAPAASSAASSSHSCSSSSSGGGASTLEQQADGRAALLDELQDSLLPSLLIPERRLEELVEQALVSQLERSRYHNCLPTHLSLFTDYQAGAEQLPTEPSQVLEGHSGEVWFIAFSPDGQWAASGGKDGAALLWPVSRGSWLESPRQLLRQASPCQLVAFSPDSRLILTACQDATVRLHEVASAKQLRQFSQAAGETVVAVSWFPDSQHFLVATHKQLLVYGMHQAGTTPQQRLPTPHSYTYDAAVGPGGTCIISVGQDRKIAFTRLSDQRVECVAEAGTVTSLHLSPCNRFLTTNLADSTIHLWQIPRGLAGLQRPASALNGPAQRLPSCSTALQRRQEPAGDPLDALPSAPLLELRMADARPSRYVLRSCVGGATSGFVACGAEDCQLYLWSRISGELLARLPGHSGCINSVVWHPRNPHLIASASDDGTIRTWLAPAAATRPLGMG